MKQAFLTFILVCFSQVFGQDLVATDTQLRYPIIDESKVVQWEKEGKLKSAFEEYLRLHDQAVNENNLLFLWGSKERLMRFFYGSFLDKEGVERNFKTLHNRWNLSNGASRNIQANTLLAIIEYYRIGENFGYD
ncbi:MAG: hypothetical protein KJ941_01260, partial [Bacteroidetes bacterium]|nr:hypothetical protein [Bacteroidota bacterium]